MVSVAWLRLASPGFAWLRLPKTGHTIDYAIGAGERSEEMRRHLAGMGLTPIQLLGGGLLLWHVDRAVKHQRDCPDCAGRDFVAIALDVPHLWRRGDETVPGTPSTAQSG